MMNTRFGEFGGQYIPEILMSEINHVAEAYEKYKNEPCFSHSFCKQCLPDAVIDFMSARVV